MAVGGSVVPVLSPSSRSGRGADGTSVAEGLSTSAEVGVGVWVGAGVAVGDDVAPATVRATVAGKVGVGAATVASTTSSRLTMPTLHPASHNATTNSKITCRLMLLLPHLYLLRNAANTDRPDGTNDYCPAKFPRKIKRPLNLATTKM